jgi:SAM-dependent methyltransferase
MINKNFTKIIDLGFHPFADTFISKKQENFSEPIYLLSCFLNKQNGIIMNNVITNDHSRYNQYNYSYTSSNSTYSKNYWKQYSKKIIEDIKIDHKTTILEIGSNDGYLLKCFKKKTNKIFGVDASKFICQLANKKGIKTINKIFNYKTSNEIKNKIGKADLIIANNVVNHSNNVLDFIKGVKNILKENGIFIFEVPYWYNLVLKKQFDQIYHEHVNYFTVKNANYFLKKHNLEIINIMNTEYHGGSIRFFVKIKSQKNPKIKNNIVKKYIRQEEKIGVFKLKTYKNLEHTLKEKKIKFLNKILFYKKKGYKIIGVGAPAKGNTLLNYLKLDSTIVDFVTDNSKYKINKYTPLSRIPIFHDRKIRNIKEKNICIFFLAWNLEKIIKRELKKITNKNIKFISFFN